MTHTSLRPRVASISVAALMLAALAMAQEKKLKAVWVKTPDGLTISAQFLRIEEPKPPHPCLHESCITHETRTGQRHRLFFEAP
jgi:hypothetical protein